jgi:hypothetical protein
MFEVNKPLNWTKFLESGRFFPVGMALEAAPETNSAGTG